MKITESQIRRVVKGLIYETMDPKASNPMANINRLATSSQKGESWIQGVVKELKSGKPSPKVLQDAASQLEAMSLALRQIEKATLTNPE